MTIQKHNPEYKTKRLVLTAKFVETLKKIENPRPLNDRHVKQLLQVLRNGDTFEGVFVFNNLSTKTIERYRVIDGNHRLKSVIDFLEESPKAQVVVDAHIYDHLTEDQELQVFLAANRHRPSSQSDTLFVMQDKIPIWHMIQEDFPVDVAIKMKGRLAGDDGVEKIRLSNLLKAYFSRYGIFISSSGRNKIDEMVKRAQKLDKEDYRQLKEFVTDMIDCFGKPSRGNIYFKAIPMTIFAKVYFCNIQKHSRKEIVRRFKEKVQGEPAVMSNLAISSAGMIKSLTQIVIDACNKSYSDPAKLFVTPEQYGAARGDN